MQLKYLLYPMMMIVITKEIDYCSSVAGDDDRFARNTIGTIISGFNYNGPEVMVIQSELFNVDVCIFFVWLNQLTKIASCRPIFRE